MKLYFSPGACSLSPHIALREAGIPFDLEQVDLRTKTTKSGEDYTQVNPKGYVPAFRLDNGDVLTEGAVLVQYLADQKPESKLAPANGTMERVRLQEWLHYIATEMHKGVSPLYNPKLEEDARNAVLDRLQKRFDFLGEAVAKSKFLTGDTFTVADGYAYYTLRAWKKFSGARYADSKPLRDYVARVEARPAVKAAVEAEGLPLIEA